MFLWNLNNFNFDSLNLFLFALHVFPSLVFPDYVWKWFYLILHKLLQHRLLSIYMHRNRSAAGEQLVSRPLRSGSDTGLHSAQIGHSLAGRPARALRVQEASRQTQTAWILMAATVRYLFTLFKFWNWIQKIDNSFLWLKILIKLAIPANSMEIVLFEIFKYRQSFV